MKSEDLNYLSKRYTEKVRRMLFMEEPNTNSLVDDPWVIMSTSKVCNYFRTQSDGIFWAFDSPSSLAKVPIRFPLLPTLGEFS